MKPLTVAVIGAGAVGQVLGAHLTAGGHRVTIVARSAQLAALRDGVLLAPRDGARRAVAAAVVGALPSSTHFDAVFLAVRGDQLAPALDMLRRAGASGSALVLCMPVWGPDASYRVDGFEETWLLFPGFGAKIVDSGAVEYEFARRPTELGPLEGPLSARLERVALAFAEAGIPVRAKPDLGYRYAGLTAVGGPFAVAVAQSSYDLGKLARNRGLLRTCTQAAKECIALTEARTRRSLGLLPRLFACIASTWLGLLGPFIARRSGSGRLAFVLSHRQKVALQDRALLVELYNWGARRHEKTPALANLLGLGSETS